MSVLLLDTHLLLWAALSIERLPPAARAEMEVVDAQLAFSVVSVWEMAIKAGLGRRDFPANPRRLRQGLLNGGYREITVTGEHALAVGRLPSLHRDPFDRLLIAQAEVEGATLLTADKVVARYPGSIRLVI